MDAFLKLVAEDLVSRYPGGLGNVTVVFPGKRARLFLNDCLCKVAGHTVWAPAYRTMQELFLSFSPYTLIDQIEAICLLHKAYVANIPDCCETLDTFYAWGEVMLADFDDIDKHMVDAHMLFSNIEDLERLTSDTFLSQEQERVLQHFFSTFDVASNTEMRERFRRMWHAMPAIYDDFNAAMRRCGRLTEGALYRDVVESMDSRQTPVPSTMYAFVGLNVLSKVEIRLMKILQGEGRAIFYWDYDHSYLRNGYEAGLYMENNLQLFGNAIDGKHFGNMQNADKHFTYVATAGSSVQARYIPTWLSSLPKPPGTVPDTVIVLCDEGLLEYVLHSIPSQTSGTQITANITMGYPLTSTPVYGLIKALLALQTDGWNAAAGRTRSREKRIVEQHPLIRQDVESGIINVGVHVEGSLRLVQYIQGMLEFVAGRRMEQEAKKNNGKPPTSNSVSPEHALLNESIFRAHTVLAQFAALISSGTLSVGTPCLVRIIDQALRRTSVPFHGEPAEGLQVMGLLETRCLDFDNILILGAGEGKLPSGDRQPSFIPYTLRRPFGLTTIEHRVCVQAYYFYRLLQRARNITFVYDTANSDGTKNEMSRFLRQLLAEAREGRPFPDRAITLVPSLDIPSRIAIQAANTPAAKEKLQQRAFSPSAIEKYINCPLHYYLRYVGGMDTFEEEDDKMDPATFGDIFHHSAESIYRGFIGHQLTSDDLQYYLNPGMGERKLQDIVNEHMYALYMSKHNMPLPPSGDLLLRRDVIVGYLQSLLRHDLRQLQNSTRQVVACEKRTETDIVLPDGSTYAIGGIIDRLDRVTDSHGNTRLQVIDYKTMSRGKETLPASLCMDDIFEQKEKYQRHIFQTFLYCTCEGDGDIAIQPTVFYTQDSSAEDYSTDIRFHGRVLTDFRPLAADFRTRLGKVIQRIFTEPFAQAQDKAACTYCPFRDICRL